MRIIIKNANVSFPNLFTPQSVNGGDPRYSASFVFDAGSDNAATIEEAMKAVAKDKWGNKAAATFKSLVAQDKVCLHDGETKADSYPEYSGKLFLNAANKMRPTVVDGGRQAITEHDGLIHSGALVNASVEIWAQDSQFGKRINAALRGVQYVGEGEHWAGGSVAKEDEFEEIPTGRKPDAVFSEDIDF